MENKRVSPFYTSFKTTLKSILDIQIYHRWHENVKRPNLKLLRIYDAGNIDIDKDYHSAD